LGTFEGEEAANSKVSSSREGSGSSSKAKLLEKNASFYTCALSSSLSRSRSCWSLLVKNVTVGKEEPSLPHLHYCTHSPLLPCSAFGRDKSEASDCGSLVEWSGRTECRILHT